MTKRWLPLIIFFIGSLVATQAALAYGADGYDPKKVEVKAEEKPAQLENVGIKEQLGEDFKLSTKVFNAKGELVSLSEIVPKDKPFIFSLIYYSCPNLCNFHMNGVVDSLKKQKWTVGKEFEVVALSFDPKESYTTANAKKANYIKAYGRSGENDDAEKGWHFLTAPKESVEEIAKNVGFSFEWSEEQGEWAHSSAAIMITPQGKISRYLHGVHFPQQDMRLALLEAAQGKVGDIIDSIVLYCFKYNPTKNKYTIYAYNLMKAGGTVMILLLGIFLVPVWLRERRTSGKNKS